MANRDRGRGVEREFLAIEQKCGWQPLFMVCEFFPLFLLWAALLCPTLPQWLQKAFHQVLNLAKSQENGACTKLVLQLSMLCFEAMEFFLLPGSFWFLWTRHLRRLVGSVKLSFLLRIFTFLYGRKETKRLNKCHCFTIKHSFLKWIDFPDKSVWSVLLWGAPSQQERVVQRVCHLIKKYSCNYWLFLCLFECTSISNWKTSFC